MTAVIAYSVYSVFILLSGMFLLGRRSSRDVIGEVGGLGTTLFVLAVTMGLSLWVFFSVGAFWASSLLVCLSVLGNMKNFSDWAQGLPPRLTPYFFAYGVTVTGFILYGLWTAVL